MDADAFIKFVFESAQGVVVVVNAEDGYKARRWHPGKQLRGAHYFCISTVRETNPRDDVLRRQTQDLVLTYDIVLDDVGTKVDRARLERLLLPTIIIETSSGNEQWHYVLESGVEPARAAALIEALARAGLTDMGARRADRIMRLPGSVNEKYGAPFEARVLEVTEERLYTFSQVCAGLGVVPVDTPALPAGPRGLPDGSVDPVEQWLYDRDMVLGGPNPRGWLPVRCPQEEEHTGEIDHGTDYLPGAPGVFKCMHSHGNRLTTSWLRSWIREQDPEADLAIVPRRAMEQLGVRLAAALGISRDREPPPGPADPAARPNATEGQTSLSQEAWEALQARLAGGGLFVQSRAQATQASPVQLLAAHLAAVHLDAAMLPDADLDARGKVALHQGATDPRVHTVMQLIGMDARFNVLSRRTEVSFSGFEGLGEQEEEAGLEGLVHACHRCGMRNAAAVREAVARWAIGKRYSPVNEWILSAPWDGKSRFGDLCATLTMRNKAQSRWRDVVVRRWLIQTVAAVRNWELGEKATDVGHVMVLQGEQGLYKSRWVGALMPEPWVTIGMSLKLDTNERDAAYRATKAPITELGELDASFRRSDMAALRNFLTTRIDLYRPAYGRHEVSRPRCTSFVATVNPEGFLVDRTGDRRFWPLAVSACRWDHGIDMQQLWAEAWALQASGEPFWLRDDEIAMHAEATGQHAAPSDAGYIIEDLRARRENAAAGKFVHMNAKELCARYLVKGNMALYVDLNTLLNRHRFEGVKVRGKDGFWVPPDGMSLTKEQEPAVVVLFPTDKGPKQGGRG